MQRTLKSESDQGSRTHYQFIGNSGEGEHVQHHPRERMCESDHEKPGHTPQWPQTTSKNKDRDGGKT